MSKKLLLADDSITIQKVIGITFAGDDFDLTVVSDGDSALEKARTEHPDLILADVFMPGINGYELCTAVKQDPALRNIPVLLLTGTFEPFDEGRATDCGAEGWIAKPFESQTLIHKVEELLVMAAERASRVEETPIPAPVAVPQSPIGETPMVHAAEPPSEDVFDSADDEDWPMDAGEDIWTSLDEELPVETVEEVDGFELTIDEEEEAGEPDPFALDIEEEEELPAAFGGSQPSADADLRSGRPDSPGVEVDAGLSAGTAEGAASWGVLEEEEEILELQESDILEDESQLMESPLDLLESASLEKDWMEPEELPPPAPKEEIEELFALPEDGEEGDPWIIETEAQEEVVVSDVARHTEPSGSREEDPFAFSLEEGAASEELTLPEENILEPVEVLEESPGPGPSGAPVFAAAPAAPAVSVSGAAVEEKIASLSEEEISRIVEKVAGSVIERLAQTMLERIAWEVVPDLAESMIKEEIRKIREEVQ